MTFHDFITAGVWVSVAAIAVLYAMLQHLLRWHASRRMRVMAQLIKAMDDGRGTPQNGHRKPDAPEGLDEHQRRGRARVRHKEAA